MKLNIMIVQWVNKRERASRLIFPIPYRTEVMLNISKNTRAINKNTYRKRGHPQPKKEQNSGHVSFHTRLDSNFKDHLIVRFSLTSSWSFLGIDNQAILILTDHGILAGNKMNISNWRGLQLAKSYSYIINNRTR